MRFSKRDLLVNSRVWGGAGVTGFPALFFFYRTRYGVVQDLPGSRKNIREN